MLLLLPLNFKWVKIRALKENFLLFFQNVYFSQRICKFTPYVILIISSTTVRAKSNTDTFKIIQPWRNFIGFIYNASKRYPESSCKSVVKWRYRVHKANRQNMSEFRHVASYSKKKMKLCPSIMCLKGILKRLCKSDENKEEIVLTRHTVTKSKINPTLRGGASEFYFFRIYDF